MTSPLFFFSFLLLKQTNRLSSDRSHKSQETSKRGKNISDTLADKLLTEQKHSIASWNLFVKLMKDLMEPKPTSELHKC